MIMFRYNRIIYARKHSEYLYFRFLFRLGEAGFGQAQRTARQVERQTKTDKILDKKRHADETKRNVDRLKASSIGTRH